VPDSYLKPAVAEQGTAKAGVIYTCPMHAQIRQNSPGNCPICGMTLEPLAASETAEPNHELDDMTRRFWIGLVLTLPVFILEMGSHIPGLGLDAIVPPTISTGIQFGLTTPVVLWAGWPFFQRGWASLVGLHLNMFTLISLGTGAAYLYSLAATFVPGFFPAGFRMMGGAVPVCALLLLGVAALFAYLFYARRG
jgi:Cu+-exporting ATPase